MIDDRQGLRARLHSGAPVLATFLMLPRVEMVELAAAGGFAAVVLDLEHAPIGVQDIAPLAAAGRGAGIFVVARLGHAADWLIAQVLDAGVDGVLVPHVSSAAEARKIVLASRYPPQGERSLNPYARGAGYAIGSRDHTAAANEDVAVMVMIEGKGAVEQVPDICRVRGLDAIFVGPVDLAAALGVPGDPEHPRVQATVMEIFTEAARTSTATASYAPTPEAAARWLASGARFVALSADIAMAARAFTAAVSEVSMLTKVDDSVSDDGFPSQAPVHEPE